MILALLAAAIVSGSPQSTTLRRGYQPTATIDRAVASFTGHAIGEEGGARAAVDARLRLATCPTVALSWRSAAQDAVVVTCSGPEADSSWRIFVAVRRAVVAPTLGSVAAAAVVAPVIVRAEPVIRRGDPVLIEAGQDGFSITRQGFAQGDALPGARLAIRIEGTALPVQAVAVGAGRVTLPGWTH